MHQWLCSDGKPTQQPSVNLYLRMILPSVRWDMQEIIYQKLLNHNQTITSELYCQQLRHLKDALDKETSIFDKKKRDYPSQPHNALTNKGQEKLVQEKMLHPPCSWNLVLSHYHWFRCLQSHLDGLRVTLKEEVKNKFIFYFNSKLKEFYPVDWVCRIHQPFLCRGVKPLTNVCPGYDTKKHDGKVPIMLELWVLPLLPVLLWPWLVAPDRGLSMGQIEQNCIPTLNWIAWNRTVLTLKQYLC